MNRHAWTLVMIAITLIATALLVGQSVQIYYNWTIKRDTIGRKSWQEENIPLTPHNEK